MTSDAKFMMGHPTLNMNSRSAGLALARSGMLGEFHTLLDTTYLSRMAGATLGRRLARRALPAELSQYSHSHPMIEVYRLATQRIRRSAASKRAIVDSAYAAIDRHMAKRLNTSFSGVYAYEDGAARVFQRAADFAIPRVYDLPIGYWRAGQEIMQEEAEAQPDWAGTMPSQSDSREKLEQKELELRLASEIVVASEFTRSTLALYPGALAPVHVIPYGAPPAVDRPRLSDRKQIRALYVGGLTQRKGLSYLFEGVARSEVDVHLTVVGARAGESEALNRMLRLPRVTWAPSLPHAAVLEMMRESDVLLFPSLFEGYGLVISEALSQGLPVVSTSHTAAPDLITDGSDGWVVPIRDADAIASCLNRLADVDVRNSMKSFAVTRARELSWSFYEARVSEVAGSA